MLIVPYVFFYINNKKNKIFTFVDSLTRYSTYRLVVLWAEGKKNGTLSKCRAQRRFTDYDLQLFPYSQNKLASGIS